MREKIKVMLENSGKNIDNMSKAIFQNETNNVYFVVENGNFNVSRLTEYKITFYNIQNNEEIKIQEIVYCETNNRIWMPEYYESLFETIQAYTWTENHGLVPNYGHTEYIDKIEDINRDLINSIRISDYRLHQFNDSVIK